jgi:uncharacterized protein YndB with AHSA1/START domain
MSDRTIELTRTIDASPATVFRALTDPGELSRWWTTTAESDARTGGSFAYVFEFEDPSRNHTYSGDYHEVVADERLSYPWHTSLGETRVEVALRPVGDGTELKLVHTGWDSGDAADEALELHVEGWSFFLDNLRSTLEGGADLRVGGPMGQKTPATV